jgi:hypothetical protein
MKDGKKSDLTYYTTIILLARIAVTANYILGHNTEL